MRSLVFQNYHKHSYYTNVKIPDSIVSYEDYCKRAAELGHGIISSVEHGWQGRYIECFELAQKYNLKFLFGTEAYWVKDRLAVNEKGQKDGTNAHICILAMNENGRQAINDILSEAAINGYYRQSRVDLGLLLSLPKDDVVVTTACLAFWKYDDIDDIVAQLHAHFGKHFYLEVQYHNTDRQANLNEHILDLSNQMGIPLIMGCDSHYIYPQEGIERDEFIKSKGITYADEEGFYMDYPDGETAYQRFAQQCVLPHNKIMEAIENTNIFLDVKEYDCPVFNHDIKMVTLYPDKTQEEKDKLYEDLIWDKWGQYKKEIPEDQWPKYEKEINYEVGIVKQTFHSDYFLTDYAIVEQGKRNGGRLSLTGRGSAVSFFTNRLLGFTNVDRISAKVKMYPERFMSATRILETHSLADIDMNVAEQEPFWEAQEAILGYNHSKQMIAYQQLQPPAAWKIYAKSQGIPFDTANAVSDQIKKWQKDVAHADEASKDSFDLYSYISAEFHDIYRSSERYQGIVASMAQHPCASLIYSGDIRREIGYVFVKPQAGDGGICCCMDGKWAEKYGFLKNDWLKVNVVKAIFDIFDRVGIDPLPVNKLLAECTPDSPAWDLYKTQCTYGLNQVEQTGTSARAKKYAPRNISELAAFVAAIRPGFKSMYKVFESREHFDYGIPAFDRLIQTEEMPNTFVLYQEQAMATLNYAGIPMEECYAVIKSIAKKRAEDVYKYKEAFLSGFAEKVALDDGVPSERATEIASQVWQIIEDSSSYSFNASHAYCVALDSLYGAWLKANYPLAFYETYLRILNDKGDKDRMAKFREEAEHYFRITFPPFKYGQDNRRITMDAEHNAINNALSSVKEFGSAVGEVLYQAGQEHLGFIAVAKLLTRSGLKSKLSTLVKIGYFSDFGNIPELLEFLDVFDALKQGTMKILSKNRMPDCLKKIESALPQFASDVNKNGTHGCSWRIVDMDGLLEYSLNDILSRGIRQASYEERISYQLDCLGYVDLTTGQKEDIKKVIILEDPQPLIGKYSDKPWAYRIETRSIGTGRTATLYVGAKVWDIYKGFKKMDVIKVNAIKKNEKGYWNLFSCEKATRAAYI